MKGRKEKSLKKNKNKGKEWPGVTLSGIRSTGQPDLCRKHKTPNAQCLPIPWCKCSHPAHLKPPTRQHQAGHWMERRTLAGASRRQAGSSSRLVCGNARTDIQKAHRGFKWHQLLTQFYFGLKAKMNGDLQKMLWTKEEEEGDKKKKKRRGETRDFAASSGQEDAGKMSPTAWLGGGVGSQTMTRAA